MFYLLLKGETKRPFALIRGDLFSFKRLSSILSKYDYVEIDGKIIACQDCSNSPSFEGKLKFYTGG